MTRHMNIDGSRYSGNGKECIAPGCHREDTLPVFPVVVVTHNDDTTDYGEQLMFLYCPEHMTRPYAYEQRGSEAPEITAAIKQWREAHNYPD